MRSRWQRLALLGVVALVMMAMLPSPSLAATQREVNAQVQVVLDKFKANVTGAPSVLAKAKGILVLPKVIKAGIGIGGEYGQGALLMGGHTVDYYNMISASYGFQLGAQKKSILLAFMDNQALEAFRNSNGWKVGVDASVALVTVGAEGNIESNTLNKPIIGFVFDQKGLMYDLSLEGAKFSKIHPDP